MKVVHLSLVALLCMSVVVASSSRSHAQSLNLGWLDPVLVTEIEEGRLVLVVHESPEEIVGYKPTSTTPVLHAWQDKETQVWGYKIIKDSNSNFDVEDIKDSQGAVVNFEGSFTDSRGERTEMKEKEPTLGAESTPTPSINPNPENSDSYTADIWKAFESSPEETKTPEPTTVTESTVISETTVVAEPTPVTESESKVISETTVVTEPTPVTESSESESVKATVPVTIIQNGEVITLYKEARPTEFSSRFVLLPSLWDQEQNLRGVTEVIAKFAETYGSELSSDDYTLFNNIATTRTDKYWSEYNYWEVKKSQLERAIRAISKTYRSAINQRDVDYLAEAIRESKSGYVVATLKSDSIDRNTADGWDIHAEMFAATISKDSDKVQFFAWSSSKSGVYVPGRYSEFNKRTVSNTIKRWLFAHVGLLVQCKNSPNEDMGIWMDTELSLRTLTKTATHTSTSTSTSTATSTSTLTSTSTETATETSASHSRATKAEVLLNGSF